MDKEFEAKQKIFEERLAILQRNLEKTESQICKLEKIIAEMQLKELRTKN